MTLCDLQSYRCARDAAPPRSADPPWRFPDCTSRSSSGVGIGIRPSTAPRILLCSSTIRFERAERRSCKRRQNANAVGRRGWNGDRTQPRDMVMAHLATFAASLNQAHLQPVGCFAKADEHRVGASFPRSYVFARNRATTREQSSLRPLQLIRNSGWAASSSGSALFGIGSRFTPSHRLASRMGTISPSGISRVVQSNKFATVQRARRATTASCAFETCGDVSNRRIALKNPFG